MRVREISGHDGTIISKELPLELGGQRTDRGDEGRRRILDRIRAYLQALADRQRTRAAFGALDERTLADIGYSPLLSRRRAMLGCWTLPAYLADHQIAGSTLYSDYFNRAGREKAEEPPVAEQAPKRRRSVGPLETTTGWSTRRRISPHAARRA